MFELLLIALTGGMILGLEISYFKAKKRQQRKFVFLTQAFLILLMSLAFLIFASPQPNLYTHTAFFLAILASFFGDLLMDEKISITKNRLIDGISAFSIAHVFYVIGFIFWFSQTTHATMPQYGVTILAILGISILAYRFTGYRFENQKLRIASFLYSLLIATTLASAVIVGIADNTAGKTLAILGATLFFASDFTIALRETKSVKTNLDPFTHLSYVVGQFFLQSAIML